MVFAGMDNILLTVMAYGWFLAICQPLHYMVIHHEAPLLRSPGSHVLAYHFIQLPVPCATDDVADFLYWN